MANEKDRSQLGKFGVTAQLFNLIDSLSAEKQFILLKQLLGTDLPTHLMRMVLDLSEAERLEMLRTMGEEPTAEKPVTTISLDDSNNLMRGDSRQACRIPVRMKTAENTHDCTIVDISTFGAFIKSHTRHASGKNILLAFFLPGSKVPIKSRGKIVRSTPEGIGVRFEKLGASQLEAIRRYCENLVDTVEGGRSDR